MKKLKKVNLLIFIINIILFIVLCVLENLYANSCTYDVRARTTICNYKQLENIINILYWIIMINSIVNVVSSIILLIKKGKKVINIIILILAILFFGMTFKEKLFDYIYPKEMWVKKPIIYIYPTKNIDLTVKISDDNLLTTTYPKYKGEWKLNVEPNGNIFDYKTKKNYYALYYEAKIKYKNEPLDEGFIVKKEDTIKFLEEKLNILGLNEREANEFIMYWLPRLEENNLNFIKFKTTKELNKIIPIDFSKKPDTLIRILMEYKPIDKAIKVNEQKLENNQRQGFTIVEWGGREIQ